MGNCKEKVFWISNEVDGVIKCNKGFLTNFFFLENLSLSGPSLSRRQTKKYVHFRVLSF